MARARNIKPGFFRNADLVELPFEARLLFIGLWTLADREGRLPDRPKQIKMEIFPADSVDVDAMLSMLQESGFLMRYQAEGKRFIQVLNFAKHQMPHHKELASEIPAPPGINQVTRHPYDVPAAVREQVFDRDGRACLKCGDDSELSIDHVLPLASGGDNSTSNLQTLCRKCNSAKGSATKDYRAFNVDSTLDQRRADVGAMCRTESGFLNPDSRFPIPDSGFRETHAMPDPAPDGAARVDPDPPSPPLPQSPKPEQPSPEGREPTPPPDPPPPDGFRPTAATPAAAACRAMRAAGLASVNPSSPELAALLDAGATVDVLADAAARAVSLGKGFAYALGVVRGQMADAARLAAAVAGGAMAMAMPPPARASPPEPAWRTEQRQRTLQAVPGIAAKSLTPPPKNFIETGAEHVVAIAVG